MKQNHIFFMSMISQDFYTVDELAALQNVCKNTVYNWVLYGKAPPYERFRGALWFYKKSAHDFIKPKRGRRKKKK